MHPTRATLAQQRRTDTLEPKAQRMARPKRFPYAVMIPLWLLCIGMAVVAGFHQTHNERLPHSHQEIVSWLTTGR